MVKFSIADINQKWLGNRYTIIDVESGGILATSQVCQIVFGSNKVKYARASNLSTHPDLIFLGIEKYGSITIRGSVLRNTALWDKFQRVQDYFELSPVAPKKTMYGETIIINCYSNQTGIKEIDNIPISIIVAENCVCTSHTFPSADSNNNGVPLEEIVLQPSKLTRVSL